MQSSWSLKRRRRRRRRRRFYYWFYSWFKRYIIMAVVSLMVVTFFSFLSFGSLFWKSLLLTERRRENKVLSVDWQTGIRRNNSHGREDYMVGETSCWEMCKFSGILGELQVGRNSRKNVSWSWRHNWFRLSFITRNSNSFVTFCSESQSLEQLITLEKKTEEGLKKTKRIAWNLSVFLLDSALQWSWGIPNSSSCHCLREQMRAFWESLYYFLLWSMHLRESRESRESRGQRNERIEVLNTTALKCHIRSIIFLLIYLCNPTSLLFPLTISLPLHINV